MAQRHLLRLIAVSPGGAYRVWGFPTTFTTCSETSTKTLNFYDDFWNFSTLSITLNFNFCACDLKIEYQPTTINKKRRNIN